MNNLKEATDFMIWLAFITTLIATVALVLTGSYRLIVGFSWDAVGTLGASLLTLGLHYAVRSLPTGGG